MSLELVILLIGVTLRDAISNLFPTAMQQVSTCSAIVHIIKFLSGDVHLPTEPDETLGQKEILLPIFKTLMISVSSSNLEYDS